MISVLARKFGLNCKDLIWYKPSYIQTKLYPFREKSSISKKWWIWRNKYKIKKMPLLSFFIRGWMLIPTNFRFNTKMPHKREFYYSKENCEDSMFDCYIFCLYSVLNLRWEWKLIGLIQIDCNKWFPFTPCAGIFFLFTKHILVLILESRVMQVTEK